RLRGVRQDPEDPRLQGGAPLEAPDPVQDADPGLLHHLLGDGAAGHEHPGDAQHHRPVLAHERREGRLVSCSQRVDESALVGDRSFHPATVTRRLRSSQTGGMKAIAVHPGQAGSIHLAEIPHPSIDDIADGSGVRVQVLRVGVDGTDKEIIAGEYGAAPPGDDFLVTGHESLGRVVAVGPHVPDTIRPGGYVVASVRRPDATIYGQIGLQDFTTADVYYERGINLLHGYLTEEYVEDARFVFPLPDTLADVGVLLEPTTVAEKGLNHAYEIQRRIKVWEPRRACILGSGTIGL